MKIGIFTFHRAHNYGAMLQAYALQEFLSSKGHDAEIVDYRPDYIENTYAVFPKLSYAKSKTLLRNLWIWLHWPFYALMFPAKIFRRRVFEKFISEHFRLSGEFPACMKTAGYDAVAFGSDQIWNFNISGLKPDKVYWGAEFIPAGTLKFSYAASAGAYTKRIAQTESLGELLDGLDAISVRENDLAEQLRPLSKKPITTVLDPTLLASPTLWERLAQNPNEKEKYLLVYEVYHTRATLAIARRLARELNLKIVRVWAGYRPENPLSTETQTSVQRFLGLIKNASCVVTTSFHAVVFSAIFKRDFYYVSDNNSSENRVVQILDVLGLSDRIAPADKKPVFSSIDWEKQKRHSRLERERENSEAFIRQALESQRKNPQ